MIVRSLPHFAVVLKCLRGFKTGLRGNVSEAISGSECFLSDPHTGPAFCYFKDEAAGTQSLQQVQPSKVLPDGHIYSKSSGSIIVRVKRFLPASKFVTGRLVIVKFRLVVSSFSLIF